LARVAWQQQFFNAHGHHEVSLGPEFYVRYGPFITHINPMIATVIGYVWDIRGPYWALFLVFAILPFLWAASWPLRAVRARRLLIHSGKCPHCGYDLRATPDRCPECGTIPAKPAEAEAKA
jgi:hypothetical protein